MYAFRNLVGAGQLPEPLSKEEESRLARQAKAGDSAAYRLLIESNIRLVFVLIKKVFRNAHDKEDLVSVGFIGLIKACRAYDPEKEYRLSTFASRCIVNEINMYFRAERKRRGDVSLEQPISENIDGDTFCLKDTLPDETSDPIIEIEKADEKKRLRVALKRMNKRYRAVVKLRYCAEMTQEQVGKRLSISQSYVSRVEKRIIKRLKTTMEVENMARKLSEKTYEICKLIAEGHRNKVICDLTGASSWTVSSCKRLYPDVIAEFKGKKMDGTPLEKPAPVEPEPFAEEPEIVEEPAPVPAVDLLPKKHSIAELFQQIDALKAENATLKAEKDKALDTAGKELCARIELEKQLAEAKGKTSLDKGKLLSLLLAEIDETDDGCFYEYIKGFSHAIDLMVRMEGE